MKKLTLSPETLRVDSFAIQMLSSARAGTVHGHVTERLYTRPECAVTVYDTCDCRGDLRAMAAGVVTGLLHTCPECANTGPYSTCA